jgi:hypothetical protein
VLRVTVVNPDILNAETPALHSGTMATQACGSEPEI